MAISKRFLSWLQRPFRRAQSLHDLQLTYFTRANCPLCKEALSVIESARAERGFRLEIVDIDSDPQFTEQYGDKVPVLAEGNRTILWGKINPVLLKRYLDGMAKSRP